MKKCIIVLSAFSVTFLMGCSQKYDISEKTFEQIDVSYAFSYGIVGSNVIVNRNAYGQNPYDGIFCYDEKNKTYSLLTGPESVKYGFTLQGVTNNMYARKYNEETIFSIINLEVD